MTENEELKELRLQVKILNDALQTSHSIFSQARRAGYESAKEEIVWLKKIIDWKKNEVVALSKRIKYYESMSPFEYQQMKKELSWMREP